MNRGYCKFYKVYLDDKLYFKGFANELANKFYLSPKTIKNITIKPITNYRGYRIEWERVNISNKETFAYEPKKESPYDCVARHLRKYGNTSLIKSELCFLDKLKEEFNLDVRHYKKGKDAYGISYDVEDWVITWLDFGKERTNV